MKCVLFHAALVALQAVVQARAVVVESLDAVPAGWRRVENADPRQHLTLRVALVQSNEALFEQTLYDISDPQHRLYGRHLSRDDLAKMLKPRDTSTAAVLDWLSTAGVQNSHVEDEGEWINFRITVGEAESLLNTTFDIYTYLDTGVNKLRALEYSVPEDVAPHITMIAPIIRFGQIKPQGNQIFQVAHATPVNAGGSTAGIPTLELNVAECNVTTTPECLRALYKVGSYQADPSSPSLFGIGGFIEV